MKAEHVCNVHVIVQLPYLSNVSSDTVGHSPLLEASSSWEFGSLVVEVSVNKDITVQLIAVGSHWEFQILGLLGGEEGWYLSKDGSDLGVPEFKKVIYI